MREIESLWPDALNTQLVRTPFRILQEQAWLLNKATDKRLKAGVMQDMGRTDDPRPFRYSLWLRDGGPGTTLEWLTFTVVEVLHGTGIYPVEVRPDGGLLATEGEFCAFLESRFASEEVRQAIRVLASVGSTEVYCEDLLPDDYVLTPIRTPYEILQEQGWALSKKTNGLVGGVMRTADARTDSMVGRFAFSFFIEPGGSAFRLPDTRYKVMEVEHGPGLYPLAVRPGELEISSEEDFIEFVRQEMASREVRDAIRIVASYAGFRVDLG